MSLSGVDCGDVAVVVVVEVSVVDGGGVSVDFGKANTSEFVGDVVSALAMGTRSVSSCPPFPLPRCVAPCAVQSEFESTDATEG